MFYFHCFLFIRICFPWCRREEEGREEGVEGFTCPKCNREFRNTTLLTRHVNDCLDRDF
jgi:hypothetical protein